MLGKIKPLGKTKKRQWTGGETEAKEEEKE